jgi:hypothetical protein
MTPLAEECTAQAKSSKLSYLHYGLLLLLWFAYAQPQN